MLTTALLAELKQYIENHDINNLKIAQPLMDYLSQPCSRKNKSELDDYISHRKKPGFTITLFQLMDSQGGKDSEIYTRAGLDRRHFSKIRSNPNYQPSKTTAIALALALELDREDAEELLASAGFTLTESVTFDLIIGWCIERGIHNLNEVNQALDYFSQKTIGTVL